MLLKQLERHVVTASFWNHIHTYSYSMCTQSVQSGCRITHLFSGRVDSWARCYNDKRQCLLPTDWQNKGRRTCSATQCLRWHCGNIVFPLSLPRALPPSLPVSSRGDPLPWHDVNIQLSINPFSENTKLACYWSCDGRNFIVFSNYSVLVSVFSDWMKTGTSCFSVNDPLSRSDRLCCSRVHLCWALWQRVYLMSV